MKRGLVCFAFSMICGDLFAAPASACPVATGVAAVPLVAVPVAVQSSCAAPQQAVHQQAAAAQAVAPSVETVPVVVAYAVPAVSFLATPVVVEQIVKVKHHRKFRTPVRSFLFR